MPPVLLIVDDEAAARYAASRVFAGHQVLEAATVAEARLRLAEAPVDVILLDYDLPGENGLVLLKELTQDPAAPAVILLTAFGGERLAVEAMKSGAYDYLAKPYDIDELRLTVARAAERQALRREVDELRQIRAADGHFGAMLGHSRPMRALFEAAARVAATDLPVLLLGESGCGKDLLARELHARSARSSRRLVALNCSALPENLVESELFGYEKGAFTGALTTRAGKFEQAHRGTLFLDEIGDMTPATQAKILRAAESGEVERLGSSHPVSIDVRLLSATNKNPQEVLREDLYYRLAAVTLTLPPLRDRTGDIPILAAHFWADLEARYARRGPTLTPAALAALEAQPWPGNVRQLRHTLERLFVLAPGPELKPSDIGPAAPAAPALDAPTYREAKLLFETEYLTRRLRDHNGNVTRTAEAIGLARQSLQEKIRELGIERD